MLDAQAICNRNFTCGRIDDRIYGSFIEHMGRVVYSGIYEPKHPLADENGFRSDVLTAVREMGVKAVRYPGGNFVSTYHWEDGVGPVSKRPKKIDLAWRSIETNEFGTNEFLTWSRKAGISPIFTINLGTRGIEDAIHYLEYCNFPNGTQYSDMRIQHGFKEPYGIHTWCLGNEMDGNWQIGHKTAVDYGKLAAEAGKAMKRLDPSIELIVCGSSLSTMESYPSWDATVLDETYEIADYLALHQYYGGQEKGTAEFLAQSMDMQRYISTIRATAKYIKAKHRSDKDMKFSLDEWGVWALPSDSVNKELDQDPWKIAPAISEQIYTLQDALLFAEMMLVILRNSKDIKIACQSLLTNVSACIMTEAGGNMWKQTIYYPYACIANYARGTVLDSRICCKSYPSNHNGQVPFLDEVSVYNEKAEELVVYLINRHESESMKVRYTYQGFELKNIIEAQELNCDNKMATNQFNHDLVVPRELADLKIENRSDLVCEIKPLSFNMIRISLK